MQTTGLIQKELRVCIDGARALTEIAALIAVKPELQDLADKIAHHVASARTAISQALAIAAASPELPAIYPATNPR
jgi:hypothetical protein